MATPVNVFNVTISPSDVLDLSQGSGIYNVETQGGAPTDTINQLTGVAHPGIYELRVKTTGHYWTLNHNPAGSIRLAYGMGFVTENPDDFIILRASDKGNYVFEYQRLPIFAV